MINVKNKKTDLDIDFIGEQGSLTIEEEKALSDFFKQRKLKTYKMNSTTKKIKPKRRAKSIA
ncbi:MAG: hypothetical protein H7296_10220 [Bacteroidia bacterium]|nr:hypothetical protein [Bacteroidia bacterium]